MASLKEKWIELARDYHRVLILLVSVSLLALLAIQAYWIHVQISLEEHRLNEKMKDVLLDIHHQIENDAQLSEQLITVFSAYQDSNVLPQLTVRQIKNEVTQMMDSVLYANKLAAMEYDFAFYHSERGDIILSADQARPLNDYTSYSERAGYRVKEALGGNVYRFGIYFQNKFWFLLRESLGLFALSFLLILVLMSCFASTLLALNQQRKITGLHNEFINNLAHELKTPVFASSVIVKILRQHQKEGRFEKLTEPIELLENENQLLKRKIEQILEFAFLEESTPALKMQPVDIHQLIQEHTATYRYLAQAKGGTLIQHLAAEEAVIMGDPGHLQNLLQNLLDNALKYSPGKPVIQVETLVDKTDLVIKIKDQGMGISKEAQLHVFDKFYRAQQGDAHDTKGFGLGLSYVKTVAELHEGKISLMSSKGKGSCFTLRFPLVHTFKTQHELRS